jgi:hypothetical protein
MIMRCRPMKLVPCFAGNSVTPIASARAGKLSAAEQRELEEYLAIESALISLKSKARRALKSA